MGAVAVLALVGGGLAVATSSAQAAGELCQGQPVTISATHDRQRLTGTDGADVLSTAGFDKVVVPASGGDDLVCATSGRDALLRGGPGADSFFGGPTTLLSYGEVETGVQIDLAAGTVVDGGETDTVSGIHDVGGSRGADTFVGTSGDDTYYSGDQLATGETADVVHSGAGDDVVRAGSGSGVDLGPGDDRGLVVDGTVDGGAGDDDITIYMSGTANGGPGRDDLYGWVDAVDTREPAEGDRFVLNGGSGRDLIRQPSGAMLGASDCPSICARARIDGGSGWDTLAVRNRGVVDLAAGTARTSRGRSHLTSVENVTGSSRDQVFRGDSAANRLAGGGGNDVLIGRGGRDRAYGGQGRDRCVAEVRRGC
jgi:Ca2+-binding RTX toxin-like protein